MLPFRSLIILAIQKYIQPINNTCPGRAIKKSRIGDTQTGWGFDIRMTSAKPLKLR
jgi:hypothetical protein